MAALPTKYIIAFLLVTVLQSAVAAADVEAVQRVLWDKQPISVQLNVGDERRIQFQAPVSVGIPSGLQGLLRVQSVNSTVYLLSQHAFPKTRLLVRELDTGRTVLLDVTAVDSDGKLPPIAVQVPSERNVVANTVNRSSPPGYASLTRFAAQQLYAPQRLVAAMPGVRRVPIQNDAVALLPGKTVHATPLIAWRSGDLYVTAVKLANLGKRAHVLDPRRLRGNWLSATFQHVRLLPSGTQADTTAVYLVSAQPFAASF